MPNSITIVIIAKIRAKKEQLSSSSEKKKSIKEKNFSLIDVLSI